MSAKVLASGNWRRAVLLAALVVGVGLFAGGVSAGSADGTHHQAVAKEKPDAPQTLNAFIFLQPDTVTLGNCPAPANGGTTQVGCRFVLDMMVNAGTNAAPDGLTAQQSFMTFTYQTIQNGRVSLIG